MKKILLVGAAALLILGQAGCARHYVITLNNGNKVTTKSKPKLEGGRYVYTDITGKPAAISQMRVREIAPASEAKSEHFSSGSKSPK